jgi:hypothetical protein
MSTSSTYRDSASGCFHAFTTFPTRISRASTRAPAPLPPLSAACDSGDSGAGISEEIAGVVATEEGGDGEDERQRVPKILSGADLSSGAAAAAAEAAEEDPWQGKGSVRVRVRVRVWADLQQSTERIAMASLSLSRREIAIPEFLRINLINLINLIIFKEARSFPVIRDMPLAKSQDYL